MRCRFGTFWGRLGGHFGVRGCCWAATEVWGSIWGPIINVKTFKSFVRYAKIEYGPLLFLLFCLIDFWGRFWKPNGSHKFGSPPPGNGPMPELGSPGIPLTMGQDRPTLHKVGFPPRIGFHDFLSFVL